MNKLLCVLGWEERFIKGLERSIASIDIDTIDVIAFTDYSNYTDDNKTMLVDLCELHKKPLAIHSVIYNDPVKTWKEIYNWVNTTVIADDVIWLDISTMPRETIWTILFFLKETKCIIKYIYWSPQSYTDGWLCKEPGSPRLLFKHSGITDISKPTALMVLTGFDSERTRQLIDFFQPKLTLIGIQEGNQFDNEERNSVELHYEKNQGDTQLETFSLNAYDSDLGLDVIRQKAIPLLDTYNLILSSMGPKLSAISSYQLVTEYDQVALAYVPTKLYNTNYSAGIKESPYSGIIDLIPVT